MPRVLNKYRDALTPGCVVVMRPSKWGNPFVVGRDGVRGECVDLHDRWLDAQPALLHDLPELTGRDLVCCCAPARCHADTLLRRANMTLRLGIVGSRGFPALYLVEQYVRELPPGTVVISGGAPGVDLTAALAADARKLEVVTHRPTPGSGVFGLFARNTRIVEDSNAVVAFQSRCRCPDPAQCRHDGWSHGTADTIAKARRAGKLAWIYRGSVVLRG